MSSRRSPAKSSSRRNKSSPTKKKRVTRKPTKSVGTTTRIARLAKGKKPQYFSDPATDKLLWMTLTLMEELSVTRDRLDAVERLLSKKRLLKLDEIDRFAPDAAAAAARAARRSAFVERMMRAVHAELEAIAGREMPKSEAEVVAAVEA